MNMKVAALLAAFAATANAFAPSSSFTSSLSGIQTGNVGSSALSMAMERTYIMVRYHVIMFVYFYNTDKGAYSHMTCTIVSHLGRLLNQQIKPDGVQRGIVGNIISRFETKGYKLAAMKTKQPTAELLNQHYCDLVEKPFFPKMRDYMMSGPVVCMVWEGKEAVTTGRKMLGATNPLASEPGTIRGDYCIEVGRNICHGSDSVENAEKEIGLWFEEGEVLSWESHSKDWIYE
jgi:nucleoside-diphosphate kinase